MSRVRREHSEHVERMMARAKSDASDADDARRSVEQSTFASDDAEATQATLKSLSAIIQQ